MRDELESSLGGDLARLLAPASTPPHESAGLMFDAETRARRQAPCADPYRDAAGEP